MHPTTRRAPFTVVLALWTSLCVLSGCFHSFSMVEQRNTPQRVLLSSNLESKSIKGSRTVHLDYQFTDGRLMVNAQEQLRCEQRQVETYQNFNVITQHLPSSHWWTLGSGLIIAGVGAAGMTLGAELNPPGETGAIMDPSEAQDRDMGRIMVPVSFALAAAGGLLVGSELSDWVLLSDRRIPKSDSVDKVKLDNVDCAKGPAKSVEVSISPPPTNASGHRINFRADAEGQASLDLLLSPLVDYAFGEPFATLTCEGCEPQALILPAPLSAELVVAGQRRRDIEAWLAAYPDLETPMAAPVVAALAALDKRVAEIRRIKPEREREAAQEHLWAGRVMRARDSVVRCLLRKPRHSGCKKLLKEIDEIVLRDLVDRAKQYIRWHVPQRALLVIDQCLDIRPRYRPCSRLKGKAGKLWSKAKKGVSYRVRSVKKKRDSTAIITELKSRHDYEDLQVSVAIYQGDEPVCTSQHNVGGVARQETVAFEITCNLSLDKVERVVLRVESTG